MWENETAIFHALMDEICTLNVNSVCHVPWSTRRSLAQVLSAEFSHACHDGLWGFAWLFVFAKAVLRSPPRGGLHSYYSSTSVASR